MAVTAQDDDTDALCGRELPRGFEDLAPLMEVPTPGIFGPELPVLRERDPCNDDLPVHTSRRRCRDPGEEVRQLRVAEHRLSGVIGVGVLGAAVSPRVNEEEVRRALNKAEVCVTCSVGWWIDCGMVVLEGIVRGYSYTGHVAVPVVLDLVIINDVNPRQILAHGGPVGGGVDLSILATIVLCVSTQLEWNVGVDEVSQK